MAFWLVGVWHSRRSARSLYRIVPYSYNAFCLQWSLSAELSQFLSSADGHRSLSSLSLSLSLISLFLPILRSEPSRIFFVLPPSRFILCAFLDSFFFLFLGFSVRLSYIFFSVVSNAKFFLFFRSKIIVFQSAQKSPRPSSSRDRKPKSKQMRVACVCACVIIGKSLVNHW